MQNSVAGEKSVFTIVLNWNNLNDTSDTIQCLLNQVVVNHKIILVDNNSKEYIRNELKNKFPNLIFIDNDSNLGYTGGNNVGIKYALENGADIIIIANNDIFIYDRFLISKIVKTFQEFADKISIIGPRLMYFSEKENVEESGTTFFYSKRDNCYLNDFMLSERKLNETIKYYDGVPGAFMAVKKDVFEKIGLLDERIFLYGDEIDFCYRAWKNDQLVAVNNSLIVYHKGSRNKTFINPLAVYYITRNSLYFLKKHKATIRNYRYFLKRYLRDYAAVIAKNTFRFWRNQDVLFAQIKGVFDGVFNRMGQRF